jgi:hypothetical protein
VSCPLSFLGKERLWARPTQRKHELHSGRRGEENAVIRLSHVEVIPSHGSIKGKINQLKEK